MMAMELRSPHQRRSDQLSILTRRPPPLQSHGRFAKTFADVSACAVSTFDPSFDSDAETDGPTSGSSLWRREFSRVVSASSGISNQTTGFEHPDVTSSVSAATGGETDLSLRGMGSSAGSQDLPTDDGAHMLHESMEGFAMDLPPERPVPSPPVLPLATVEVDKEDVVEAIHDKVYLHEEVSEEKVEEKVEEKGDFLEDEESDVAMTAFGRGRARSFYGRGEATQDMADEDSTEEKLGPMSRAQLREVLDEDYHLFYSTEKQAASQRPAPLQEVREHLHNDKVDHEWGDAAKEMSPAPDSPELSRSSNPPREGAPIVDVSHIAGLSAAQEEAVRQGSFDGARSRATGSSPASLSRRNSVNKVRSLRVRDEAEAVTMSVVSDEEDAENRVIEDKDGQAPTAVELDTILREAVDRPRLSSGAVPLFVEEIGRMPRVAVVDGKVQRVRVSKASCSSFRLKERDSATSRAIKSFSSCLRSGEEDKMKSAMPRGEGDGGRRGNGKWLRGMKEWWGRW